MSHDTAATEPQSETRRPSIPRSSKRGPNLATLDQLRSLRKPRLLPPAMRRHSLPRECAAC